MPHRTSQPSFLFASLPASTSAIDQIPGGRTHSIGSISSGSVGQRSFYNLHRESNKSNIDLNQFPPIHPNQPHQPHHHHHHQIYQHQHLYSTAALNRSSSSLLSSSCSSSSSSSFSGHSIYSSKSAANSSLSLASSQFSQFSQFSVEPIQHAIGSMPAPRVASSSLSSSSSSSSDSCFSLNSLNSLASSSSSSSYSSAHSTSKAPIIIAAVTATSTVRPVLSSSVSLASFTSPRVTSSKHSPYISSSGHSSPPSCTSSTADLSSPTTATVYTTVHQSSSSSLPTSTRPLLLPSAAASLCTHHIPPRKRIPNSIPPLDTKTLAAPLPDAPKSSTSSTRTRPCLSMTSSSPSSAGLSPVGATFSEVSTPSSSPATSTFRSSPFASMAITELVISESQYVGTIKRVANALGKAAENTVIAGRKDSVTLRTLTDRWNDILRMHVKFHDDVVAVNEDLRETAGLLNSLLVTLEPILIDHGRDLSGALKKLIRRDQNSEHTFAEWNAALRQPFEHLAMYDEWLQRIDPQSKFSKDYRSHISGLTYKIKMVSEANQHPRNVLRRLSTIAKGVIKRRSSGQILSLPPPETPTTPTTPQSYATSESFTATAMSPKEIESAITESPSSSTSPCLPPLPQTVENLAITETNSQTESVTTGQHQAEVEPLDEPSHKEEKEVLNDDTATFSEKQLPPTPVVADDLLSVNKQLKHRSSATSDLSSTGTLTMTSSSASIHSKSSTTDTLLARHTSLARQQFLKERDARKATLRVGTHELIQAKAESLQSPTFRSRLSVETMRVLVHPRESEKPPVKSLISFWEQVSDPLEV